MSNELTFLEPNKFENNDIHTDVIVDSTQEDFELARASIKKVLEIGSTSLDELSSIAKSAQRPDGFEAVSKMIKEISDASNKLLDIHEKMERISSKKNIKPEISDRVYLSTSDIGKMLEELELNTSIPLKRIT